MNPVSWRVMEESVNRVQERLRKVAALLAEAGVPYAVVGGNAVAAWVSRVDELAVRNTRDVDILLRRDDFPAAKSALEKAGFHYRRVASLGQATGLDVFLESPSGSIRDAIHVIWANEPVLPDSPEPAPDPSSAEESSGISLISLESLLRMKLTAFRDKDRMHLRDLIEVGLIGNQHLAGLPLMLAERLQMVLETPGG